MLERIDGWVFRIVKVSTKYPLAVLILYFTLIAASFVSVFSYLSVDTDSSKMLSENLAFQKRTQDLNNNFPSLKNALIVVLRSDNEDAADHVANLIVEQLESGGFVSDIFAPSVHPFFRAHGPLYKDLEDLEGDVDALNRSASFLATLRDQQNLPNFFHSLLTAEQLGAQAEIDVEFLDNFYVEVAKTLKARTDGGFAPLSWSAAGGSVDEDKEPVQRVLYALPTLDFTRLQPARPSIESARQAISSIEPDLASIVDISLTGDPVLRFEELRSVSKGIGVSLSLSLVLVALLLSILYWRASLVLVTMISLVVGLVLATGFAAVFFGALNLVSVAFVVLLVGLGLDFSIHAIAHLYDSHASAIEERLHGMAQGIGGALLLSCLTTAIAFLSFTGTDFRGISQLGALGAFGVFIAFSLSITLVPALLVLVPWFRPKARKAGYESQADRLFQKGFSLLRIPLLCLLTILIAGSLLYVESVRFDADPIALRNPDSPSMQALDLLSERTETVPYRLSLIRDDEESAAETAKDVELLDEVERARSLSDFVPGEQDEKVQVLDLAFGTMETIVAGEGLEQVDLPKGQSSLTALKERLLSVEGRPEAKRLAEQLVQIETMDEATLQVLERDVFLFFPSLIATIDAQLSMDFVTLDNLPEVLKQRYVGLDGKWRVDVVPKGNVRDPQVLEDFVASVERFDETTSGAPLQVVKAGETVTKAIIQSLLIAGVLILGIAFFVLQRVSTLLAIFIPLLIAGLITAGASAFFGIAFNYANVIVLPLLIGLGVDSGIHVATRRMRANSTLDLFSSSTPRAVLFSGLTTIAAFATLSVSEHRGTASMGIMLAISITATLLATIFFTPLLMDFFDKIANRRQKADML